MVVMVMLVVGNHGAVDGIGVPVGVDDKGEVVVVMVIVRVVGMMVEVTMAMAEMKVGFE